jgi:signal transduction histidine kinase
MNAFTRMITRRMPLQAGAVAFVALVCFVVVGLEALQSWGERSAALADGRHETANLALSLARNAEDTIRVADANILGIARRISFEGSTPARLERWREIMVARTEGESALSGLVITDESGRWLVSTVPGMTSDPKAGERDYFRYHRDDPDESAHIGPPFPGASAGAWFLPVSRRLIHADGSFAGVVIAAIDVAWFEKLFAAVDIGRNGSIALILDDGTLVTRRPFRDSDVGNAFIRGSALRRRPFDTAVGTDEAVSPIDGIPRVRSHHSLDGDPAVVAVALATDDILADWRVGAWRHLLGAAALAFGIALLGLRLVGQIRKRQQAEEALRAHGDDLKREIERRTLALSASEARLLEAIETIPEAFVLFDAEDRLVLCNTAYRALYGLTEEVATPGTDYAQLVRFAVVQNRYTRPTRDVDGWLEELVAQRRAVGRKEWRYRRQLSDGRWIEALERRTGDGGIVGLRVDVTEARRHEALQRDREKLAALGQLAGGVAHEINNLLQPALLLPELIRNRLRSEDDQSRDELKTIVGSVRQAREIVRNILQFARRGEATLVPVDLAVEAHAALDLVRGILPLGITLREERRCDRALAAVDRTQLSQVLTNLVLNAAQAMNDRGVITVTLGEMQPTASEAHALEIASGARFVTLAVADQGTGIDASIRSRVFEPFFSTKPVGQGSGLGLSVAYGILQSWNGAIGVDSVPGRGATFTLYIPAAASDLLLSETSKIAAA